MARKLLLSYDASLDWHYNEDSDFRRTLVEFLLRNEVSHIESCVSSTMYLTVADVNRDPEPWKELIEERFPHLYFSIVLVAQTVDTTPQKNWADDKPNGTIENNFNELVARVKTVIRNERNRRGR